MLHAFLFIIFGILFGEFIGYWFHRLIQHAMVRHIERLEQKKPVKYTLLFVPIAACYYMHMWHHYTLFPEPNAPGREPATFRPSHEYQYGKDFKDNPLHIGNPSNNPTRDRFLNHLGLATSIDWFIVFLACLLLGFFLFNISSFAFYALGLLISIFINQFIHESFHILPYPSLKEVPSKAWLNPGIVFANLGEHNRLFRPYYQWMLRYHITHHYHVELVAKTNVLYRGQKLNAGTTNFTMYNPIYDYLFGTACNEVYKEVK